MGSDEGISVPTTDRVSVADGVALNVRRWRSGASGRPFILVHGLSSNARLWDGVAIRLAGAGHPVAAIDLRSHGGSDAPADGYDTATAAADVAAVADALGLADAVVAGQSWGGNVVVQLAAKFPHVAAALALVDGGWIEPSAEFPTYEACATALRPPDIDGTPVEQMRSWLRSGHPGWSADAIEATIGNLAVAADGTVSRHLSIPHHMQIVRSMWDDPPRPYYPAVGVPVLLLPAMGADAAHNDRKRAALDAAVAGLPDATIREYPDSDHDIHAQHPGPARRRSARSGRTARLMARLLVIMGSGETAPTMIKPHRAIFERIGDDPAVMIDTPYGFQPNADDITSRALTYFSASVGRPVQVASWRTGDIGGAARERSLAALREAGWVFCGPGSPTYALRQWRDTPVPDLLVDTLRRPDAAVVFASAAALTLGSHAIPVYEIYKAGIDPSWTQGLDVVRAVTGLPAVVIPHYDNAEGGHHDTRFCYLGEGRLSYMESLLPDDAFILGVDEHTAVILDLDARTASVVGNSTMTIRRSGHSIVHPNGDVVPFDQLTAGIADAPLPVARSLPVTDGTATEPVDDTPSLRIEETRLTGAFDVAAGANDIDACVETILELEQAIVDWAADTADDGTHERATLRQMVVRLGDLARGQQASDATVGPLLDVLMTARSRARAAKDFAASDAIRDRLAELDIEIQDTPDGPRWQRR